jgi:hypothetical protein
MGRFSLKKLYGVEVTEQLDDAKILKRFAALENTDDNVDTNRASQVLQKMSKLWPKRIKEAQVMI